MNLLKSAPGGKAGTVYGIRPEHLDVTPGQGWPLIVDTVELLGAERLIYARVQGMNADEQVIVRVEEGTFMPNNGDLMHVTPRPDRIHTFDADTGKRI